MDPIKNETIKQYDDINVEYPETDIKHLEDEYPLHDRRHHGYKLVGFVANAKPSPKKVYPPNAPYPYGMVPIWKYLGYGLTCKYDGEKLRQLRKERGVGKMRKENA